MLRSQFFLNQNNLLKMVSNRAGIPPKDSINISASRVFVIRNEALEPFLAHSTNCANLIGIDLGFYCSEYIDSIAFTEIPAESDFMILWLNWDRIKPESVAHFFSANSRISSWARDSRCYFVLPSAVGMHRNSDFKKYLEKLGWPTDRQIEGLYDPKDKNPRIKMGYLRDELDSISNLIGLRLPSMHPLIRIRALILDLDNTLYQGVFGEDSDENLHADNSHVILQKELKNLQESGVLLCIASKNNISDIDSIFESNLLSELKKQDFVLIEGGWESKSESISRILSKLNFGENFVAFIGDNKRELFEVGSEFPNIICIDGSDPKEVLLVFRTSLSFDTSSSEEIAKKRVQDIQNSASRKRELNRSIDKDTMLVDISTKIRAQRADKSKELVRANELFRKTNQFNLSLARTEPSVDCIFANSHGIILSSISDRFSDSGIISAIYYLISGDSLEIAEFVISCRALGRDAEKYIFRAMLEKISEDFENLRITAVFREGPKNKPAFDFIHRYFVEESEQFILDSKKLLRDTSKWYALICEQ